MSPTEPPAQEDRALVEAVLSGAPGAFELLVRRHQALCWHIINRMVRHPEDTRDLCQETFLRVHRHLPQYRFESALRTWIGRVAYSVAVRYLERKRLSLVEPMADDADGQPLDNIADDLDIEAASGDAQVAAILHMEVEALPPLQRMILTLYHLDGLSIPEIAGVTGLAQGTIKSHLFRTRQKLRERLATRMGANV